MNILQTIIDSIECVKHNKHEGEPCFTVPAEKNNPLQYVPIGICNQRAKKYGCRGKISRESLFIRSVRKK